MKRLRIALLLAVLGTACTSIIGVPDLTYEPATDAGAVGQLDAGGVDARADTGGQVDTGTSPPDAHSDAATCDPSKTASDPLNCGSCGHACKDDAGCSDSMCAPTIVATVGSAYFTYMIENGDYLYAVANTNLSTGSAGGIWQIPKAGGTGTKINATPDVDDLTIIGNKLFFLVYEDYDPAIGDIGGVYACDITNVASCNTPTRISGFPYPNALHASLGNLYVATYSDSDVVEFAGDAGADAGATKVAHATDLGTAWALFLDSNDIFFISDLYSQTALEKEDATRQAADVLSHYDSTVESPGQLRGTATDVFYTAYDTDQPLNGVIRKIARSTGAICELAASGGTDNVLRPRGIYVDDKRVYWTNQGRLDATYTGGSVVSCEVGGCCAKADVIAKQNGGPNPITGDSTHIYWAMSRTGQIFKAGKL